MYQEASHHEQCTVNSKQPAAVAVEDVVGHADVHLEDGGGVQAAHHGQPAQDRFILRTARYVLLQTGQRWQNSKQ